MDRLYAAGALEVYFASLQIKKTARDVADILSSSDDRAGLAAIVFRETTTIGVRYHEVMRERLEREIVDVRHRWEPCS